MSAVLMLDTNAISALVKGRAGELSNTLEHRSFCISVITEAELRFGLARRPVNPDLRSIIENLLLATDSRAWTSACAARYGQLRTELETLGKPLALGYLKRPGGGAVDKDYLTSGAYTILQDGIHWPASVSLQPPVDPKREHILA